MKTIILTSFTELSLKQKEKLLLWRNHERIRKWMLDCEPIPLQEHLAFIETLYSSRRKRYFLVHDNDREYGVVYFTDINLHATSAELGIYANPDLYGMGRILMKALMNYARTHNITLLIANVFSDNEKAKHLYEIFDFRETKRFFQRDKEMIRMERLVYKVKESHETRQQIDL